MKQKDCPNLPIAEAVEQLHDAYQNLFMVDCKNSTIKNAKDIKKELLENLQKESKDKPDFSNLSGWVSTDVTEEQFYNRATEYAKLKKDLVINKLIKSL